MSDLIAIAYPDEAAARRACTNLAAGVQSRLLDVEDVLVISHDEDGRIHPVLDAWQVGFTGGVSVIAGGLIGTLLVGPLLGIVLGGALAARTANRIFDSEGIPERFVDELRENLTPTRSCRSSTSPATRSTPHSGMNWRHDSTPRSRQRRTSHRRRTHAHASGLVCGRAPAASE